MHTSISHGLLVTAIEIWFIEKPSSLNPFPAEVANKRHLGSAPKSHFCDLTGKTEVIGMSGMT
jgi:hypothetical protein